MFKTYEVTIPVHLLPAIVNGDTSGLTDDDERELAEYETDMQIIREQEKATAAHISLPDDIDSASYFGRSSYSRLVGTVVDCEYLVRPGK